MRVHVQHCIAIVLVLLSLAGCGATPTAPIASGGHVDELVPPTVSVRGSKNQVVLMYAGHTTTYSITFTNTGTEHSTYRLAADAPASPRGWIALAQPLPEEITLDPDTQFAIPVTITVPLTASVGMRDTFAIEAHTTGEVYTHDTANVSVRVRVHSVAHPLIPTPRSARCSTATTWCGVSTAKRPQRHATQQLASRDLCILAMPVIAATTSLLWLVKQRAFRQIT